MNAGGDDYVRGIARDSTVHEITQLRGAADQLEAFLDGDLDAWSDAETLRLHQLSVRVQSHVAVLRRIERRLREQQDAAVLPLAAAHLGARLTLIRTEDSDR